MEKKRLVLCGLLGLVVGALCLFPAGCGKDTGSLARILKEGRIRVGMTLGYPPFCFKNGQGTVTGFDVDMTRELARRMGVSPALVFRGRRELIPGLLKGDYDAILSSMAVTPEREEHVRFTSPYYYSEAMLWVRSDSPYKKDGDMAGKVLGAAAGTTYVADVKLLDPSRTVLYEDDVAALNALIRGEVDGVVTDRVVGLYVAGTKNPDIRAVEPALRKEELAVAVRKEDAALAEKISGCLEKILSDGTWNEFMRKVPSHEYGEASCAENRN